MSTLFLRNLAEMSPLLISLLEDKFNISFLNLLLVTVEIFKLFLE